MRHPRISLLAASAFCLLVSPTSADIIPPRDAESLYQLPTGNQAIDAAIDLFKKGDYAASLARFEAIAKGRDDLVPARVMLAKLFLLEGKIELGRGNLERAAVDHPDHPDVYLTLGTLALAEGRLTEASLAIEKAEALLPKAKLSKHLRAGLLLDCRRGTATIAERRGEWPAAVTALEALLQLDVKSLPARARLGASQFRAGRRDSALAEFRKVEAADPSLGTASFMMARVSAEMGEDKAANEWIAAACKEAPKDARPRIFAAQWLLDHDRAEEAQFQAGEAVRLAPDSVEAGFVSGLIALQLRKAEDAERIFEAIHLRHPANLAVTNQWAVSMADQPSEAKKVRAAEVAEVQILANPKSSEARATYGYVAYRLGRLDEAERSLRSSMEGGVATSDAGFLLAKVLDEKGRPDEARGLARSALDAPGRFRFRPEAKALVERLDKLKTTAARP